MLRFADRSALSRARMKVSRSAVVIETNPSRTNCFNRQRQPKPSLMPTCGLCSVCLLSVCSLTFLFLPLFYHLPDSILAYPRPVIASSAFVLN
jgi:hypothetical protein